MHIGNLSKKQNFPLTVYNRECFYNSVIWCLTIFIKRLYNRNMGNAELKFIIRHVHPKCSVEPEHTHPCCELVYYIRGEGKSVIGGKSYDYRPGTFVYIPPTVPHSEKHSTQTHVLFFAFEYENEYITAETGVYQDDSGAVLALFEEINREIAQKRNYYKYAAALLIERIMLLICRQKSRNDEKNVFEESMKYAVDYIKLNSQHCIDVQSLAETIGYSYDYFRHQFRKLYGMGAKEFILRERMNKVKELLADTDMTIKEIASQCAFESQAHLSVAFKKVENMTPAQFRQQQNKIKFSDVLIKYKD